MEGKDKEKVVAWALSKCKISPRPTREEEFSFAVTELLCWQGQPTSVFFHVCMECMALAARHVRPLASKNTRSLQIYMCCHCASLLGKSLTVPCRKVQISLHGLYFPGLYHACYRLLFPHHEH